ncbi:MAG: hypothetical protein ACYDD1_11340 [Caulobacteraceae bacterium]
MSTAQDHAAGGGVRPFRIDARSLTLAVLCLGFVAVLVCNLPGHLSYDSVVQLQDGRTRQYHSWHPPIMAWVLGLGDSILPGSALFVVMDAALLFGGLAALTLAARRVSWAAPAVALVLALSPLVLIYQGIVWKDVFFADCSAAGFICLSLADRATRSRPRLGLIALGFLLFVLASLIRQNGLTAPLAGAAALTWMTVRREGWRSLRRGLGVSVLALLAVLALVAIAGKALDTRRIDEPGAAAQFQALQEYDLIGAVAQDPSVDLSLLTRPGLGAAGLDDKVRLAAAKFYTPERVDTLSEDQGLNEALAASPKAVSAQWRFMLTRDFKAYVVHRLRVFYWTLATPKLERCLPVFIGQEGPPGLLRQLGMFDQVRPQDLALERYAVHFYDTPLYSHLVYALIAVVAAVLLLLSPRPGDAPIGFMLLGALAFTASFLIISFACDYRYLYALDVAAMVAVFHLAVGAVELRHRPTP